MMRRLRSAPGKFGLVTANGNWVTKHAYGIYSTTPVIGEWKRQSPTIVQDELDKLPKAKLTETPFGRAKIETYTVMFDRSVPSYAVIFGRLLETGERFIANTEKDLSVLSDLLSQDALGRLGTVVSDNGINIFTIDKP
jgi:acetyl-CoA C-acetyltransferase